MVTVVAAGSEALIPGIEASIGFCLMFTGLIGDAFAGRAAVSSEMPALTMTSRLLG